MSFLWSSSDLALETMRVRQSVLSSFCAWLVNRRVLPGNPVARLDRPAHRQEASKQVPGSNIMDALVAYDWPGNVRELQNVVERALILSPGPVLRLEEALGRIPRSRVQVRRVTTH